MPLKPWIRCPVCRSGKIWIDRYSQRMDDHVEYECLCRGCCRKFTVSIRVEEGCNAESYIKGNNLHQLRD